MRQPHVPGGVFTSSWQEVLDEAARARWRMALEAALLEMEPLASRGVKRLDGVHGVTAHSAKEISALVQGTQREPYEVDLFLEGAQDEWMGALCTCPYGADGDLCKHIWAVCDQLHTSLVPGAGQASASAPSARGDGAEGLAALRRLLDHTLAERSNPTAATATRWQWRVRFDGPAPVVLPYEQRQERDGGWTQGRMVGFEQLEYLSRSRSIPPEARAVGRLVETTGAYYGRQVSLDGRRALWALQGSPNVVRQEDPARGLSVERGEVALALANEAAGIAVRAVLGDLPLACMPDPDEGCAVAWELERGRVLVGRVPERAVALVGHLARHPMVIPRDQGDALLARIGQLSRVLPLRVPAGMSVARREADARIRLLLSPRGPVSPRAELGELDGLLAALRVRPLEGPALRPGEGEAELPCVGTEGLALARRDLAREVTRAEEVRAALGLGAEGASGPWTWSLELDRALSLLEATEESAIPDLVIEWPEGQRLSLSRELDEGSLSVTVRGIREWFQLDGELEVDGEAIELAVVLSALRRGEKRVALGGGRFLRFSRALRARLEALRAAARVRGQGHDGLELELDATAAPVVSDALEGLEVEHDQAWGQVLGRLAAMKRVSVELPGGLEASLRDYQRDGWAWLKRLSTFGAGACLADDMGLGKTVQTIAVLLDRADRGPALVVAPTSVGPNWAREIGRFAPSLRPRLLRETARDEAAIAELGAKDVLIASYDLARIDARLLEGTEWATLVLDEAQRVKNARTKTASELAGLEAGWRLALTGTPVENRLADLWSLFRIVSPGLLGSWESFKQRFALPIERDHDAERSSELARIVRPYVLRRTKEQVLKELPPRSESRLDVTLSPAERTLYQDAQLEALARLEKLVETSDGQDARFHALAALTRLRQLACHPRLVEETWTGGSAKLDALLELVHELIDGGHRALVFSQFTTHLGLVRAALDRAGIGYHYLDGSTSARERQHAIDAFQGGEHPLFLISLKAGGVGLNLTGADYVIHLDPWWNPAVEDQASGRAHRLGQARPVTVYRLVAKDTVEERILALHEEKRGLVAAVLEGSDRAGALSTDELMALIRGGSEPGSEPETPAPAAALPDPHAPRKFWGMKVTSGEWIDRVRTRVLRLTQKELAARLGVSPATVSKWAHGSSVPRADQLARVDEMVAAHEREARTARAIASANEEEAARAARPARGGPATQPLRPRGRPRRDG